MDVDGETDSNHDTALTLACTGGHEDLVELLLSRGADIEHRDKKVRLRDYMTAYNYRLYFRWPPSRARAGMFVADLFHTGWSDVGLGSASAPTVGVRPILKHCEA